MESQIIFARPTVQDFPPPFDPAPLGFKPVYTFKHEYAWNAREEGWPLVLFWTVDQIGGGGHWALYHDEHGLTYSGPAPDLDFLQSLMDAWL